MRKSLGFLAALFVSILSTAAFGMSSSCPDHYLGGQAPNVGLFAPHGVQEVCYEGYAVLYSDATETPVASAEYLTRKHLEGPHPTRTDDFHADEHIPVQYRSQLDDYRKSGMDRGHLSPAEDMEDEVSEHQSFSLANMIPENPDNNRHLWAGIESSTRYLADKDGSLYVVTGPIFYGNDLERLNGHVLVPTLIFKAIYDPSKHAAAAYVVRNAPGTRYAVVSIEKIDELSGLSVFPGMSRNVRMLHLFKPYMRGNRTATQDQSIVP